MQVTEVKLFHTIKDGVDYAEAHLSSGYYLATAEQLARTPIEMAMDRMLDVYEEDPIQVERLRALALSEPGRLAVRIMACDCTPD